MIETEKYFDLNNYRRVLQVATTPSKEEFMQVLKVTVAGISLLGLLGYLIFVLVFILPGGV